MQISELARLSGVSVHRLRRYEEQGLLVAERRPSGYREFPASAVREAVFISMGRDLGFSLKALAETLPRYRAGTLTIDQMVGELQDRIAEVDAAIAEQRALRRKLVDHIAWFKKRQQQASRTNATTRPRKASP